MNKFSTEKNLIRSLNGDIEKADCETIESVLKSYISDDYEFKGFHPYGGEKGISAAEGQGLAKLVCGLSLVCGLRE